MQGTHTFSLGTLDAIGRVHLSPAGRDLVRAILMRGMGRAKRGLATAEAMKQAGGSDLAKGSIDYYRHAMAFLSHLLHAEVGVKIDLREELHELRGIDPEQEYPTGWTPFLILHSELSVPDEPALPPEQRPGSDRKRGSRAASADSHRRRKGGVRPTDATDHGAGV